MSEHTKEPWRVENLSDIFSADRRGDTNDGFQIADCSVDYDSDADPGLPMDERRKNARRIVACVNACAGISNEDLELGVTKKGPRPKSEGARFAIAACERQVNELAEINKELLEMLLRAAKTLDRCRYSEQPMAKECFALIERIEAKK
jgi:cobalamin biosynthesis protein CobT